jgi:hypothetical protein
VGPSTELNFVHEAGLPKYITGVESSAIFRAIKLNTTTNRNGNGAAQKKPVVWQPPIHACKAMSTHFTNRQLPDDDEEERVVRIICTFCIHKTNVFNFFAQMFRIIYVVF